MLIKDIEAFKSTGKHVLAESVNPETGEPIEVETFFDETNHKSYELDRDRKRYRVSNVIGEYGQWEREKNEGFFTDQTPKTPIVPQEPIGARTAGDVSRSDSTNTRDGSSPNNSTRQ